MIGDEYKKYIPSSVPILNLLMYCIVYIRKTSIGTPGPPIGIDKRKWWSRYEGNGRWSGYPIHPKK